MNKNISNKKIQGEKKELLLLTLITKKYANRKGIKTWIFFFCSLVNRIQFVLV